MFAGRHCSLDYGNATIEVALQPAIESAAE
jgi:hypothetical protein